MTDGRPELPAWAHEALADKRLRMTENEARNLWSILSNLYRARVPLVGAFAEVGVYRGGSARLLAVAAAALRRPVHLFDTFAGTPADLVLPEEHGWEDCHAADEADTRRYLAAYPNTVWHVGRFADTQVEVTEPLMFVHIDVDIYQPTAEALAWAWRLLVPGGVIVVHDYQAPNCPGVTRAVDAHCARYRGWAYVLAGPGDNGQAMIGVPT